MFIFLLSMRQPRLPWDWRSSSLHFGRRKTLDADAMTTGTVRNVTTAADYRGISDRPNVTSSDRGESEMLSWTWCIPALPLLGFLVLAVFGGRIRKERPQSSAPGPSVSRRGGCRGECRLHVIAAPGRLTDLRALAVDLGRRVLPEPLVHPGCPVGRDDPGRDRCGIPHPPVLHGFMLDEEGYSRFFAYMNLFVGSMLILVMASNLLLLYLGWEGVGLCSFLLIGFWYKDPENGRSARKAFIVTRIGDVSLRSGCSSSPRTWAPSTCGRSRRRRQLSGRSAPRWPWPWPRCSWRGRRKVGTASPADVAPGRHGRTFARERAHPRRHDGDGRRLSHRPNECPVHCWPRRFNSSWESSAPSVSCSRG